MTKKVVFGSQNQGKIKEFQAILREKDLTILSWENFDHPFSVNEDGKTFWENALKKAEITARTTGEVSIADDSGLEVDYVNGQPGIFSARYSGADANDEKNNNKLLRKLRGVPPRQRGARFVCAIVIFSPEGRWEWVEGECRGIITDAPRGNQGFGYDPIFLVPELGKTFAELNPEEKNRISHRARAINKLKPLLKNYFLKS
ncbi:MAG: XTP/dITP diphosphatase [Proteobacteria bacterium]|nr:XTP/dITP diphosphatase [Pseudomonadota bacterium]